jgi:hypothetical protein
MSQCKVYKFGCRSPLPENVEVVRAQIRAAHDYRNDLVAVERGRRAALRAILDTPEIRIAEERVRSATKSTRKEALRTLSTLRNKTLEETTVSERLSVPLEWIDTPGRRKRLRYPYSPLFETERIALLDASIRGDARESTTCFWGSYLTIEASSDQARKKPLYERDGLTPSDPRFVRAIECGIGSGTYEGQIGIQIQGGLLTNEAIACKDTRIQLHPDRYGLTGPWRMLWLRVDSDGRQPIWAKFPTKLHRQIPDAAYWKWVRVSCVREGTHAVWSCEITVNDPNPTARSLDHELAGTVALEVDWRPIDSGGIVVGNWRDDSGQSGEIHLSPRDVQAIQKSTSDLRAVRDLIRNDMIPRLSKAMQGESVPPWLAEARSTIHLWLSQERFHRLHYRWSREAANVAPKALELLTMWRHRDRHLWQYADGMRGQSLRRRRHNYRLLAAEWAKKYKTVIIDDRNLSREARWGEESDVRFLAGPSELRNAVKHAFGADVIEHEWLPLAQRSETDERSWCEKAIADTMAGITRSKKKRRSADNGGNAWASRKAKKVNRAAERAEARKTG